VFILWCELHWYYCIRDLDSDRLDSTGWSLVEPIFSHFPLLYILLLRFE